MELVARTSALPGRAATMAALVALLIASALAGAAASPAQAKKTRGKAPVVKKVSPMSVGIGQKLTIRGRGFVRGRKKTTVVFKRDGARAVFVKADLSTAKLLKVTIPATLQKFLKTKDGAAVPTRFRLRVLGKRLSKLTPAKRSPFVGPAPQPADADADCDGDKVKNKVDADDDNDLLPDTLESQIQTDPCKLDTDGDRVEDGYEYESALNLNDDDFQEPNADLFYPVKLPYPNPLFAGDKDIDFDGDSLTLSEEQALWKYTYEVTKTDARTLTPLSYSDGEQFSRSTRVGGRRQPTLPADNYDKHTEFLNWAAAAGYRSVMLHDPWGHPGQAWTAFGLFDLDRQNGEEPGELNYFDFDSFGRPGYGYLSDNERDEDADGLTNFDEAHSRMTPGYWASCYSMETPYYVAYAGTNLADEDTDGDGIRDGADDQDHDDVPNIMELSRIDASHEDDRKSTCTADPTVLQTAGANQGQNHPGVYGRVNPFNPCLPDTDSRTCALYFNSSTGAPFDGSINWLALQ